MSKLESVVSAAEIARLAGVTRATVSNWRRRHADFPAPIGGTEARPAFDLHQVREWLDDHGVEMAVAPTTELRTLLRTAATPDAVARLLAALRRVDGSWRTAADGDVGGSGGAAGPADLLAAAAGVMERATAIDGVRAVVDALAERALEDMSATGVYPTPEPLARLMAALLHSPSTPDVHGVFDPACGSGSLLLAAADDGAADLYGQDVLAVQVDRTRLLLEAETPRVADIRVGDSVTADAFPGLSVDGVLCNPPYGQRDWGSEELAFDTRWNYGLPPRNESELAWVQHAIAHLRPGGTAVLLLPPAVASRPSGRKIRAQLVRKGVLRAVIGLAPGAAQPWHVGLQLWILRPEQADVPAPETMLFVDTTAVPAAADGIDWDALTDIAVRSWRAFDSATPDAAISSGVSAIARLVDVLDDDIDLTPARYVRAALDSDALSDQIHAATCRLASAATETAAVADELGGWAAASGKSWRLVTIAELADHGQLHWLRACPASTERTDAEERRPVLTAPDVATGTPASGTLLTAAPAEIVDVAAGDVLIPAVRSDRSGGRSARVAGPEDAGTIRGPHIHTLRVDPDRLDPWFLAGFLTGAENISATRTSTVRFDPSRLRVPLLALSEQQRYGEIFRRLFLLRTAARRVTYAAEHAAELVTTGLTAGALAPSERPDRPADRRLGR
ncbi:N-6 DNA methylase [Nocardia sp. CC227C]|uniref:N-6 DNA methylase n=1 Tax=Nocardia sp. CC227C TaxID=3044562 RepID=UPI00278C710F|nr:N-6 DNA methylase [Nocardia sp. CC227C]